MVKEILTKKLYNKISQYERCPANSYFRSQWEKRTGGVSKAYVAYRWAHLLVVAGIFLASVVDCGKSAKSFTYYLKWPVFLTNWALTALLCQAIMAAWLATSAASYNSRRIFEHRPDALLNNHLKSCETSEEGRLQLWIKLYSIVHSTAVVVAVGVSFVYWIFIYNPEVHELDLVNYLVHGANSVIMVVDFLMVGHPFRLAHSVYPLALIFIYTIFNYLYYQFGGTDRKGNTYIYKVMDWKYPSRCIAFSLAGHILVCVIYALLWLIFLGKRKLGLMLRINALKSAGNELHPVAQTVSLV
ncbi:protein rolling stone-like [Rhodnius prolixus]|uniref:protein rolling stone-like n=1 Tax=Rhodnius prolixus TaxID=13249 RepID=UPI003D188559